MPKDYRERRIDAQPPRIAARQPTRTTTVTTPTEDGDMTVIDIIPDEPASVRPGDGILTFLLMDAADDPPVGHLTSLSLLGTPITHDYADQPAGWTDYLYQMVATRTFDSGGIDLVTDQLVYVIWDQFIDFTAGTYDIVFDLPVGSSVERAILLRNVEPTDPGTLKFWEEDIGWTLNDSEWQKFYDGDTGSLTYNGFDATVPLDADQSIIYAFWTMPLGVTASPATDIAGYVNVDGTTLLSYTYTDPTDTPVSVVTTKVTAFGLVAGATTTIGEPVVNGWSGSASGTQYNMVALVFNGITGGGSTPAEF